MIAFETGILRKAMTEKKVAVNLDSMVAFVLGLHSPLDDDLLSQGFSVVAKAGSLTKQHLILLFLKQSVIFGQIASIFDSD